MKSVPPGGSRWAVRMALTLRIIVIPSGASARLGRQLVGPPATAWWYYLMGPTVVLPFKLQAVPGIEVPWHFSPAL